MKAGLISIIFIIREIGCSQVSTRCPVRWLERPEGNSCYRFWPTRMKTWNEARETCQQRDGDLMKLDSKNEKDWIITEIEKYPVHYEWWIGLQRHAENDSVWVWTDGTERNETKNFIPWGSGEPNNYHDSEDCAEIWDNLLNDKNCEQPLQFICERPKDLPIKCDVDDGWDELLPQYDYCFKYYGDKLTLSEAIPICQEQDGYITSFTNPEYQKTITDFLDHKDKATIWFTWQYDTSTDMWVSLFSVATNDWWSNGIPDPQVRYRSADIKEYTGLKCYYDRRSVVVEIYRGTNVNGPTGSCYKNASRLGSEGFCTVSDADGLKGGWTTLVHNDTLCSVMDTTIEGDKNWRPESCDAKNAFICEKLQGSCPYGYIQHTTTCYLLNTQQSMTWNEARGFCNLRKTTLLEIKNDNDYYYTLSMLKNHYSLTEITSVWQGLSGENVDTLKWDNGTDLDDYVKTTSTDRFDSLLSGTTQCGFMDNSVVSETSEKGQWRFGDCGDSRGTICTVPLGRTVQDVPPQKPRYECPDGYTINGVMCYRWNPDEPVDWFTAREKCTREGADLVTIQSDEEQNFLYSQIKGETWIGLNDQRVEGVFTWLDSTAELSMTNWFEKQPNNAQIGGQYSENCAAMLYLPGEKDHGKWVDYPCSYKARFMCQIPAERNIALGKMASMSSLHQITQYHYSSYDYDYSYDTSDSEDTADKAVDGCSTMSLQSSSCCARTNTETSRYPWWSLDLGTTYQIGKVVIYRRSEEAHTCPECETQFLNFRLFISNSSSITDNDETDLVYKETSGRVPAIIVLNLQNITVGRYIRIDIPRTDQALTLCEVKIFQGQNLQRSVNPSNSHCITDSTKWKGDIRHTVSGKTCQAWRLDSPHQHGYHDKTFPDGTEKEAENFCRDPLGEGRPWCYTVDPDVRWEFCPVPHCTSEVGEFTKQADPEEATDCSPGWLENPDSGVCYWLGDALLTWADAQSMCKSVGATLPNPEYQYDIDLLTGELTKQKKDLKFWLGVNFDVDKNAWVSDIGFPSRFILDKLGTVLPATTCAVVDQTGNIQESRCLDRKIYSCMKMGPFMKYSTSSDGGYKQLSTIFIRKNTQSSVTTFSLLFEYKGIDGAALKLHKRSTSSSDDGYLVRIGGNIFAKSSISKLDSDTPKYSRLIQNLCNENEFKAFWIQWTSGNKNGDEITVGRGTEVGRNVFMQWTDSVGIEATDISIATVMKVSAVYKGFWRFKDVNKKRKTSDLVNLAVGRPAKQSSSFAIESVAEKAVDGCKEDTYASHCITHTGNDYEPWWEVDLGRVYPIREVVIYRRGPECCTERMGYFRLIISMLSDSTLDEDIVYKSESQYPPYIMHLPIQGKSGRYVKIDIPGRSEYLELSEVEVYEDFDASRCGMGWIDYEKDATCYKFSDVTMNWDNAQRFCSDFNAEMVVPSSPTEQLFLFMNSLPVTNTELIGKSFWLGLHDRESEGTFLKPDGSPLVYSDWGKDEPNNLGSGEDCISLRVDWSTKSGTWNDQGCEKTFRAVCKKKEMTTTTSTITTTTSSTTTTTTPTTTTMTETPTLIIQGDCKDEWIHNPFTSSCLRIFTSAPMSFYSAASECIQLNSRLASIANSIDQDFFIEMMKMKSITGDSWDGLWIGGIDEEIEGDWQWMMDNITWHSSVRWTPGQPDNYQASEHCATIRTAANNFGLLNDGNCESSFSMIQGYICQYNLEERRCNEGWIYNRRTDTCYKYERHDKASWNNAQLKCNQNGAILATIASRYEQLFLKAMVATSMVKGAWVGAHDMQEEGIFQWIDSSTWISDLWAPDQPNNWKSNQHCAMVVVSGIAHALGLLQDDFCEDKYPYICAIKSCPAGWEKYNGDCYLFSMTNRGWEDAKADCESRDARLVIIDDENEHNFIRHKVIDFSTHYMWIGARYNPMFGEHRWIDGSSMTFTAWGPDRPGNVQGCVDYLDNIGFLWNSHHDCVTTKGPYICEKASISDTGVMQPTTASTVVTTEYKPTTVPSTTMSRTSTTTTSTTTTTTTKSKKALGKCGSDWDLVPSSNSCYKFVIQVASWIEAQTKCSEEGGNLLSILSDEEQSYIIGRLQGFPMLPEAMWIGATDADFEAGWKWVDGKPFAYLNWKNGEPNNFDMIDIDGDNTLEEDCAAIVTGTRSYFGQWNDLACAGEIGYVCKKTADTDILTIPTSARPNIETSDIIEIYQKAEVIFPDFKSHDLFEMGVRTFDTFTFSVKTKHDAHILLQKDRLDYEQNVYIVIIGGWGGTKSTITHFGNTNYHEETGLLSQYEYRPFWISWNKTTIVVGKSDQVGADVFLTYQGQIHEINYISVGTTQNTDAYWRIPKGDKYYGCVGAGWLGYRESCFLVVQEEKDWKEANNYCHKEGAELASIKDVEEHNFIFSQLPQDSYCFNTWNDTKCNTWAERGECDRNPVWMSTNCHLACKHCVHNCRDKYHSSSKCLEWSRLGECQRNSDWMIHNCAMSCGICQGAPTRGYWIGLQSSGLDQSYTWSDRSTVKFTNWDRHQPVWFNLQPRSCVAMFIQNGKWNDGQCTDPLQGFVCKQSKMVIPFTTKSPFEVGCAMENAYGYGAYCYIYVAQQKKWSDAKSNCNSLGGYLAYIGNMYTQAFVASELQNLLQDYWIGLTVKSGNWSWDGRNEKKLTMTHFDKTVRVDQANDGCFAMTTYKPVGLWKLYPNCSLKLPSICQIPREGFTTTLPTTTFPSTTPLPDCTDGWQPYGKYCYKVSDDEQRWEVAQQICAHYGSSLVSIDDYEENAAVANMVSVDDVFWIGLHDTDIEGDFVWEDGSPVNYLAFDSYEPNNADGNEDCTEIKTSNGRWNDAECQTINRFICKIPRDKAVNTDPHTIDSFPACNETTPDDGWILFGDFCLFLGKEEFVTWHEAKANCEGQGSQLTSVHSEEENYMLSSLGSKSGDVTWIGFNDLDLDNRFSWNDGTVVDYTAWASGQPNDINGGEKCVTIYPSGSWHDFSCNDVKPYICKRRKDGLAVTTSPATTPIIQGGCPEGFEYSLGNKCYYFNTNEYTTTWGDAENKCDILGGRLVSIHSDTEQGFIAANVYGSPNALWIGMHDLNENSRFDWADNSLLDYDNWAPNEPSSTLYSYSREPCVEMWTTDDSLGQWNDVKCYASRGFICSSLKDPKIVLNDSCHEGYMYMRNSCYKVLPSKQSWNRSVELCSGEGAQLMSYIEVPDEFIVNVLLGKSGQTELWMGGTAIQGSIQWTDGSKSQITIPNTVGTGCLYRSESLLSTDSCMASRSAVCKITKGSTTTTSSLPTTEATTVTNKTTLTYTCRNSSWFLYDSYCYTAFYDSSTYSNTKCSKYGMYLASIKSSTENFKIISWILGTHRSNKQVAYPYYWIGLALQPGMADHTWADGNSVTYNNIEDGSGPAFGCVMLLLYTSQWQVVSCTDRHFYICKGNADIATTTIPTTTKKNTTESKLQTNSESYSTEMPTTTKTFKTPPKIRGEKLTRPSDVTGLTGGQIAGVVIGVIGFIVIIGVLVYIVRSWAFKKPMYHFPAPSLGFDNALFHKTQDSVSID